MTLQPVSSYFSQLTRDPWRESSGFSDDIETRHRELFDPGKSEADLVEILRAWIQTKQTCLFGRATAKLDALSYCVLTEADLQESDDQISEKIQNARLRWTRQAFDGRKSGFIVWVVSPTIANAEPSQAVLGIAQRICELYLEREIEIDQIYLDQIYLEKPGPARTTWKWHAGVNYFCAQGDKRWWHDHRIPGGMALSVNSVGHLVKSAIIAKAMNELDDVLGTDDGFPDLPIDSLPRALQVAIHTISLAADTVSGKATELLPLPENLAELPVQKCPIKLPDRFADKNFCEYVGYYHTDVTLPSTYFFSSVERPPDVLRYSLDFTYLFKNTLDNPDFISMARGQQVRVVPGREDDFQVINLNDTVNPKELRSTPVEVSIANEILLSKALSTEITNN